MPRRLRLHLPGGFYHVTLRGNHQQDIFFRDGDRSLLNAIVAGALQKYAARLHAYCWMCNHIHLLIQVSEQPLGKFMQRVASEYARRMQAKLATTGHFFERRYHAKLVEADSYLLELLRYIHRNPVKAGVVSRPDQHPWSSHHSYVGARQESWVTTDFGLSLFSADRSQAVRAYRSFVDASDCAADEAIESDESALGTAEFIAGLEKRRQIPIVGPSAEALIAEACRRFEVTPERLRSPSRDRYLVQVRAWVAHQAIEREVLPLASVARALCRDESTLRQLVKSHAQEIA